MARKDIRSAWDRNNRNAMNDNFKELYNAPDVANEALTTANQAKSTADSTKAEFDQVVIDGDSSVEAAQARVDTDGQSHTTLKERLDVEHNEVTSQLAQTTDELTELESKKMDKNTNDISVTQINKNKGKLDQTYMSDEFLQQMSGNTPINAIPAPLSISTIKLSENAITARKTSFIEVSSNLINEEELLDRHSINSNTGELMANTTFAATRDFIEVTNNAQYTVNGFSRIFFYDAGMTYLNHKDVLSKEVVTIPDTAYFVRLHGSRVLISDFQLNLGDQLLEKEPYYEQLNDFIKISKESLKGKLIDIENLNFLEKSTNLFIYNPNFVGFGVNKDNGVYYSSTNYTSSDFIEVEQGVRYTYSRAIMVVVYFDKYKNKVGTTKENLTGTVFTEEAQGEFIKIMYNHTISQKEDVQINKGETLTLYEEGNLFLPETIKVKAENIYGLELTKEQKESRRMYLTTEPKVLDIPTYDGNPNTCHPSVLYFPLGWNGYRYWMAHTPFPSGNRENPSIVVSNDGENWIDPPGFTNPLVPEPPAPSYYSDVELIFIEPENKIRMYWRYSNPPNLVQYKYSETTDGITWTPMADVTVITTLSSAYLASPTFVRKYDGTWEMWTGGEGLHKFTSEDGLTWDNQTECHSNIDDFGRPFHQEVWMAHTEYRMIASVSPKTVVRNEELDMYYATSQDGINWVYDKTPVIARGDYDFAVRRVYRSCVVPFGSEFNVYISGVSRDNQWRIALAKAKINNL